MGDSMTAPSEYTTAQILGAYRRELVLEGFDPDVAQEMARVAASSVLHGDAAMNVRHSMMLVAQS